MNESIHGAVFKEKKVKEPNGEESIKNEFVRFEDNYKKDVNKGYMKVTLCYIILELLKHEELKGKDFEINLTNTAFVRKRNGGQKFKADIYKDFFYEHLGGQENGYGRSEFRIFLASKREDDINYYEKLYDYLTKNKNGRIVRPTES